jgi:hypothetical protein
MKTPSPDKTAEIFCNVEKKNRPGLAAPGGFFVLSLA